MTGGNNRMLSKTSAAYIAVGVALVTLMTLIGTSAFLRVVEIRVEGATKYTAREVAEASGVSTGDSLMRVNKQRVTGNILRNLPFVKGANISRKLPDILLIEVTESTAIATIYFAGDNLIIDSGGRVLTRMDEKPDDLIEIRGIEISDFREGEPPRVELGAETKLQFMQDILGAMERDEMEKDVSYLDVSNISNIHFGYLDRYRVILGGVRDLKHKLGRLPADVLRLEQRYPNTPGDINMTDPSGDVKFKAG